MRRALLLLNATGLLATCVFGALYAVRARPGRLSAISIFLCKSVLCGAFCMGAQGA